MKARKHIGVLALFLLLTACTNSTETVTGTVSNQKKEQTFTHTITNDTVYYLSGPQQSMPPKGHFKAGQKIRLIRNAGSYSHVESDNGINAYISSDCFQKIPE